MKTVIAILAIILMGIGNHKVFAQTTTGGCKFETDQTDAKGKLVRKIKIKLSGTDTFYMLVSRNDTTYRMTLNFWIAGAVRTVITKGELATIKMSGGFNLKLLTDGPAKPVAHYSDQTWSEYSPEYPIRSADLAKLKTIAPINVSLVVGDENVFFEFTTKDLEKIRDMVKCVMK